MSWSALLAVSALLLGCDSGIEPGIPKITDPSKIPDPMAGVQKNDPISQKAAKQAAKKAH